MTIGKQYSIRKSNQKFNYKNQKYTVTEVVSLHAVHLNIEDVHFIFHVNQLCLTANNPLPSQPQPNDQPAPIYMKSKEEWYVDEIVAEELHHHGCGVMKWFQVKYTGYAVPEWNWVMNMEDTTALEQWMEHMREFQDAHSRLPDSFRRESHPGRTL